MRDHCFEGPEGYPRSLRVCPGTPSPTLFSSPKTLGSSTLEIVWKDALLGGHPPESVGPGPSLCIGPAVLSVIPDEVFAGRLAEAEAECSEVRNVPVPCLLARKEDGNVGAPEPKKTETEWRIALQAAVYRRPPKR